MIVVVLHEPQDLVNIAHVVRGMKNFGLRDLRLVNPREYEAYRVEGIAHQTQDVLARVRVVPALEDALADCVHVVGFTARGFRIQVFTQSRVSFESILVRIGPGFFMFTSKPFVLWHA